ncbi:MAG TPA: hypothetical protein PKK69_02555, partial [Ferruginibacter sp.]|nr:hypothetical protein [Ferruginibacter sp.]
MQLLNAVRRGIAPHLRARKSIQTLFPFFLIAMLFAGNPAQAQLGIGSPYRTVSGGNWEDIANWEVFDGNTWIPAESYPDGTNSGPVEIRTGHNLFFTNTDITIDQLTIDSAASVSPGEAALDVLDGPGDDVICNGVINLGTAGLTIESGASVIIGATGQLNTSNFSNISGPGTLTILASGVWNEDSEFGFTVNETHIENFGTINLNTHNGDFNLNAAATLLNRGTVNLLNEFSISAEEQTSFSNGPDGTLMKSGFSITTINTLVDYTNNGQVFVDQGTLKIESDVISDNGILSVSSGAQFVRTAGAYNFGGSRVNNNGTISVTPFVLTAGDATQTISGVGEYDGLTINNQGTNLDNDTYVTIYNELNLNAGIVTVPFGSKVILWEGLVINNGSNSSFINGDVERAISNPGPKLFPVGSGSTYSPVTLDPSFTTGGSVTVRAIQGDHPGALQSGLNPNKTVNKFWRITNNGLVFSECDIVFNWTSDDLDPNTDPQNFNLAYLFDGEWALPVVQSRTNTSLSVLDLHEFGDFTIGEIDNCTVAIPDASFKAALVNNPGINTNNDGEIQCSEAAAYTGTLSVDNLNISDLTGIEAFTGITNLNCSGNNLSTLNISANTALTNLNCSNNQLTALNTSSNTQLTSLVCNINSIASLNLSNNTQLTFINSFANQLGSLNVSMLPLLTWLNVGNNQPLSQLNIQNGNNNNLTFFRAVSNPNLSCIQVDDETFANGNSSWEKDASATYSTNCANICTVSIPDPNFKTALLENLSINTNNDGQIQCSE